MSEDFFVKIHRPLVLACVQALQDIFSENRHADKVVDYNLKTQKKWGARDRRFFAETIYENVRWWRLICLLSDPLAQVNYEKILNTYLAWKDRPTEFEKTIAIMSRAERESIPDWLDELCFREVGATWPEMLSVLNKPARQYLRVNGLRSSSVLSTQEKLRHEGVETDLVSQVPKALVLRERKNVFKTRSFLDGYFEMQDGGSQMVAPLLQAEPGMRVIDACAGAGGKTLHLADLMKNKGKIIALDIHEWKLQELKKRAARAGASLIETRAIDSNKVVKRLENSADRVLLDVPCSGLGVLRRSPDTKWKITSDELVRLALEQKHILQSYAKMVRPGGKIVYATCSILPSENTLRVHEFLATSGGAFELEEELRVNPAEVPFDGFYAARLLRK